MIARPHTPIIWLFVLLVHSPWLMADDYSLTWYSIDTGGGTSTGGSLTLEGTIGQPDAPSAPLAGGGLMLIGGFQAGVPLELPGDCNGDGVVDLVDLPSVYQCLQGPEVVPDFQCDCANFDGDSDIDLEDFAAWQSLFTGG